MNLRVFLIEWNNKFPLDREYRAKNNVIFGSKEHREINQIDLYMQFFEDQLFEEFIGRAKDTIEKEKLFKKGQWITEPLIPDEDSDKLFEKLNVEDINSPIQIVD